MKKPLFKTILLSLSTAVVLGLAGCSSSGGSDDLVVQTGTALSGIAIDGILIDADVCIDADKSGICEDTEVSVQTNNKGEFTFPAGSPSGPLILSGGTDASTGEPFKGVLKAPAGSRVVTPLTSAIQSMVESGKTPEDAEAAIKTAMGLEDIDVDLTKFDPYNGVEGEKAEAAKKILAKQTQLQILVHTAAATVAGADAGTDVADTMENVFDAIVKSLDTGAEVELDKEVVARATRQAAAETYKDKTDANKLIVAVGDAVDTVMDDAVNAANVAESVITNGDAEDAVKSLDGAINAVAKDGGSADSAATTTEGSVTALDKTPEQLATIVADRKTTDTTAIETEKEEIAQKLKEKAEQEALESADTLSAAQAEELIELYRSIANDAALEASNSVIAIESIKSEGYNVDTNLTTAQDANATATIVAISLSSYSDGNTTVALEKKDVVVTQAEIVKGALEDAQYIKSVAVSEANILQRQIEKEILSNKNAAELSLNIALKAAQDANESATAAAESVVSVTLLAENNPNAMEFVNIAVMEAENATFTASLASQAASAAQSAISLLFIDGMSVEDAQSAVVHLKSLEDSATQAAALSKDAQSAAADAYVNAQKLEVPEIPTVDSDKQFTLPMSWAHTEIDRDYIDGVEVETLKVRKTTVDSSGLVTEAKEKYSLATGELLEDEPSSDLEYEFIGGAWVTVDPTVQAQITLSSDATVAHFSVVNADLKIVSVRDLSSETTFAFSDELSLPITFREGAKATQYEYRHTRDRYSLDEDTLYDTLEEFIATHSGQYRFSGDENNGISFESAFDGTLIEGSTGNLALVQNNQVSGVAGTWEYKKLGDSDILAIVLNITDESYPYSYSENNFFTMFSSRAYRGYVNRASSEYQPFDQEEFNEIAYEDVKSALEAYFIEANKFTLSDFIEGNTFYYIEESTNLDPSEKRRSYVFDANGSFAVAFSDGTTRTGVTYEVNENNITFSDEMSFTHMGKSDDGKGEVFYRFDHYDGYALGYVTLYTDEGYRDEVFSRIDLTKLIRKDVYIKSNDGQLLANFEFRMDEDDGNTTTGARSDTGLWNGTWSIDGSVATIVSSDGNVTTLEFFETPYLSSYDPIRVLINNTIEATYMKSSTLPRIFNKMDELPYVQSDGVTGTLDLGYKEEEDSSGNWLEFQMIFDESRRTLTLYYENGITKEITIAQEADFTALPLRVTTVDGNVTDSLTISLTLPTQSWVGQEIPKHITHDVVEGNDVYGASIVLTDTQEIVRRRFEYDTNGDLVGERSLKYGYTLDSDGKMVINTGEDRRIITLIHSDWGDYFVIVEVDLGSDGTIDSSLVKTWNPVKAEGYPVEVDYEPALKVTDIHVGDQILLRGKSSGDLAYRFRFTIDSNNEYTFYDNDDIEYRDTKGENELVDSFHFQILVPGDQTFYTMDFKENQYISYDDSEVILYLGTTAYHYIVEIVKK